MLKKTIYSIHLYSGFIEIITLPPHLCFFLTGFHSIFKRIILQIKFLQSYFGFLQLISTFN